MVDHNLINSEGYMHKTKIFAAYLPQYHATEDNDRFWGKGYTDWVGVKKALPQFEGHDQPKIPLDDRYYDLTDIDTIRWQANLAKEYGIDGFNIYHYWFKDGKQELEKPAELLLGEKDIDIKFFFTWDNNAWKRTWGNINGNDWAPAFDSPQKETSPILIDFEYGDQIKWKEHFLYLLRFFEDDRYLKIDNKPVFMFIGISELDTLKKMAEHWEILAKKHGFDGMFFATKKRNFFSRKIFDAQFSYEPETSAWGKRRAIETRVKKAFGIQLKKDKPVKYIYNYEKIWEKILRSAKKNTKDKIVGAFVKYDDTPRRGKDAMIILGDTPELFEKYIKKLYKIATKNECEMLLITAWNEWGEGAYMEPDAKNGYAYLSALKRAVNEQISFTGEIQS